MYTSDSDLGTDGARLGRCNTDLSRFSGKKVSLQHPVCVETFSESRALGRVFLRSSGRTVAMGRVARIIQNS
ncbi:hypothetical protein F2Q69_00045070 [Brassica cretica]|uniref:GTP-eEF1A C-terminal domain-containing protein n=1 Tax=Brassica cretica TaxID=69181 RepID=A0A8S9N770_BRACR|nr:hypothetical protein F2Q69_00045070 [Brassica cretica]